MPGKVDSVSTAVAVNHKQLKELIKLYYKTKKSLFIWGRIGIGKSQTVRQAARELAQEMGLEYTEDIRRLNDESAFLVIDIRLAQCDPSDLRGIPMVDREKGATVWLPPELFPRKGYGIIFFDELNLSPPLVQASAYQLILDRRLGTYVVPDGFGLVAAGNRLEDRASIFEMAAPLKNRFGHCELQVPTVEDWTDWATRNAIDMRIIGFLNYRREALFSFDPKLKENAFATPRSWEALSNLIKDIPSDDLYRLQTIAATQVGVGLAGEFCTFIRIREKLKPIEYYLKDPENCELPNEDTQPDLTWALITSLAEYYKGHMNEKEILAKIVKLLGRFKEEYAVFTLKLMASIDRALTQKIIKIPEASKLARKLIDFFE
ncbi:MAG: hypothetical protein QW521_02015 [Desulfurococcaceae archaeon]